MLKRFQTRRGEKGQSLMEFAFSLIILLFLLVGIVDLARALFTYMALRDAGQEGALYGSINPCESQLIRGHVREASNLVSDLGLSDGNIVISYTGLPCTGNGISIQVTYPNFQITMPFIGALVGSQTVPISATVVDTIVTPRCSNPPPPACP